MQCRMLAMAAMRSAHWIRRSKHGLAIRARADQAFMAVGARPTRNGRSRHAEVSCDQAAKSA